ncbi:sugar phosphate isomerase/epimerase family protein [Neolewinella maritima]|nr:sugar phosphate isomerase/epimerase [Neolewinella maritima]
MVQSRRSFIYRSVCVTASLGLLGCAAGEQGKSSPVTAMSESNTIPYLDTLGIQLYTVREQMAEDPATTLRALADLGYRQVELMDTRDIARLKPICDELGLSVNSSFMQWTAITGRWDLVPDTPPITTDEVFEQANAGGVSHVVFGYLRPEERTSADDWKRHIEGINEAGLTARKAGLSLAYHNHNFEWEPVDGTIGWELLLAELDGSLVPFELDLGWASLAGQDPASVLEQVSDRVRLLHVKDLNDVPQHVTIASMPSATFTELGTGRLDIPQLMRMGKEYGVEHCFYEQDHNWHPDALGSARSSIEFLRS